MSGACRECGAETRVDRETGYVDEFCSTACREEFELREQENGEPEFDAAEFYANEHEDAAFEQWRERMN